MEITPKDLAATERPTESGPSFEPARAVDAAGLDTGLKGSPVRSSPEMVVATVTGVAASAVLVSALAVVAAL